MSKPYTVVQSKYSGLDAIKLTEQPYEGIIYSYGKIEFEEKDHEHLTTVQDIIDLVNKLVK